MSAGMHYRAGPSSSLENGDVPKRDIGDGVMLQIIAEGGKINAVHWNIPDGAEVPEHNHPSEQIGYVIKGALELTVGPDQFLVGEGDSYIIPPDLPHKFKAVGQTEAIDVFSPPRDLSTAGGKE